jgi:hypothetical protein
VKIEKPPSDLRRCERRAAAKNLLDTSGRGELRMQPPYEPWLIQGLGFGVPGFIENREKGEKA